MTMDFICAASSRTVGNRDHFCQTVSLGQRSGDILASPGGCRTETVARFELRYPTHLGCGAPDTDIRLEACIVSPPACPRRWRNSHPRTGSGQDATRAAPLCRTAWLLPPVGRSTGTRPWGRPTCRFRDRTRRSPQPHIPQRKKTLFIQGLPTASRLPGRQPRWRSMVSVLEPQEISQGLRASSSA